MVDGFRLFYFLQYSFRVGEPGGVFMVFVRPGIRAAQNSIYFVYFNLLFSRLLYNISIQFIIINYTITVRPEPVNVSLGGFGCALQEFRYFDAIEIHAGQ